MEELINQSKIVSDRLQYHFGDGKGRFIIPDNMPFMKEFLAEVKKLSDMCKPQSIKQQKNERDKAEG